MHLWMHARHPGKTTWDMAPFMESLGFAEVHETVGKHASLNRENPYSAHLEAKGLLEEYRQNLQSRAYKAAGEQAIPTWDATPNALPLDDYVDAWHGLEAVRWIENYDRDAPFFLWLGFPGPHDPWDSPEVARGWYDGVEIPTPGSSTPPDMTHTANLTWIIYTSDHGEMLGEHNMLLKCLFYDPAVRVPLIVRPPGGREARTVEDLIEQFDLAAAIRDVAGGPPVSDSAAQSLRGYVDGRDPEPRPVSISENWGFASFETYKHKLVVDEDTLTAVQLFDRENDPLEDNNLVADPDSAEVIEQLIESHVRPFMSVGATRLHEPMFAVNPKA